MRSQIITFNLLTILLITLILLIAICINDTASFILTISIILCIGLLIANRVIISKQLDRTSYTHTLIYSIHNISKTEGDTVTDIILNCQNVIISIDTDFKLFDQSYNINIERIDLDKAINKEIYSINHKEYATRKQAIKAIINVLDANK